MKTRTCEAQQQQQQQQRAQRRQQRQQRQQQQQQQQPQQERCEALLLAKNAMKSCNVTMHELQLLYNLPQRKETKKEPICTHLYVHIYATCGAPQGPQGVGVIGKWGAR